MKPSEASDAAGPLADKGRTRALQAGTPILDGQYTLIELLEAEQLSCGAPAVWIAEGPTATYIAKIWQGAADDATIRAVWNHELRNLLKLEGIPHARSHFAHLQALGADQHAYYILIDGGGRELLSSVLANRNAHAWLRHLTQPLLRAKLWEGIARLAEAMQMLHDHGLLHRALRPECVFTDVTGDCDFVLSGFEWSLRLNASAIKETTGSGPARLRAPELLSDKPAYSMASDWFDFGLVATELLLGAKANGSDLQALHVLRRTVEKSSVLREKERRLLLGLLTPNPDERRLQCNNVAALAAALARDIAMGERAFNEPLLLAIQVGGGSDLAPAIFRLSNGTIRLDDTEGQLDFIANDLSEGNPSVAARSRPHPHYALYGRELVYRVDRFANPGGVPSWRAGFCRKPDKGSHDAGRRHALNGRPIEVRGLRQAGAELREPKAKWMAWDRFLPFEPELGAQPGDDLFAFLKFTNHIDALATAARVWPVTIVERRVTPSEEWIAVDAREEEDRDAMATALGIEVPARQMLAAFFDEIGPIDADTRFHLLEGGRLKKAPRETATWTIMKAELTPAGGRRYWFRLDEGHNDVGEGPAYLRAEDLGGSIKLQERRLAAIEALRHQRIMLCAIEEPGSVSRDTMERLNEADPDVARLDDSKRKALREIWHSQPLYALQGPPGTGKTALIETMIPYGLRLDRSMQFLATAQANETVDGLGAKLAKKIGKGDRKAEAPLIVRLDDRTSPLAPERRAGDLALALAESPLGRRAPDHIAQRLSHLKLGSGQDGKRERRDLERLVSRAANVVLTTTTSKGLADLIEDNKRFDWCLVEETGKAHGFDLALPMLSSHRMLMIGDHEQLPAFNEEVFLRLLEDPAKVRTVVLKGARFLTRKFGYDLGPQESEEDALAFEAQCARWRPMVRLFGDLFANSYRPPRSGTEGKRLCIAERLTEQHRMHPDICEIIRNCFYADLTTADVARKRLELPDPFELIPDSWLPQERILFVDIPYVQATRGAQGQDVDHRGRTVLSSRAEAEAVVAVLAQLRPKGACELQVLTPYNDQLALLRKTIKKATLAGRLPDLGKFTTPGDAPQLGATVHGFQGGEADITVISLVRNNHSSPRGGVGFLSERALLNVMLSRAKRKLVLVGSWDFFKRRATPEALADEHDRLHHIAVVFNELERAVQAGKARICRLPRQGKSQ